MAAKLAFTTGVLGALPAFMYVGLVQRVIETCMLPWLVACGFYLQGRQP